MNAMSPSPPTPFPVPGARGGLVDGRVLSLLLPAFFGGGVVGGAGGVVLAYCPTPSANWKKSRMTSGLVLPTLRLVGLGNPYAMTRPLDSSAT